eukprot:478140-Pleurochrysis_carterae.AAC.4
MRKDVLENHMTWCLCKTRHSRLKVDARVELEGGAQPRETALRDGGEGQQSGVHGVARKGAPVASNGGAH